MFEGAEKPYLYQSKAYHRSNASTVEVDVFEQLRTFLKNQAHDGLSLGLNSVLMLGMAAEMKGGGSSGASCKI